MKKNILIDDAINENFIQQSLGGKKEIKKMRGFSMQLYYVNFWIKK